jgi:glutamate-1-semialdehyde aminotransferase/thioesterase domain-containing protein/acyl carrier protein
MTTSQRKSIAETALAGLLKDSSGFDLNELDPNTSFPELGFDSLFLVQFTQHVKSRLKVKLTFRQLLEEVPNIAALIDHVAANLPENLVQARAGTVAAQASAAVPVGLVVASQPSAGGAALPLATQPSKPAQVATTGELDSATQPSATSAAKPATAIRSSAPIAPPASLQTAVASVAVARGEGAVPIPIAGRPPANLEMPAPPMMPLMMPSVASNSVASKEGLAEIIFQQNQLMSMQLCLLAGLAPQLAVMPPAPTAANPEPSVEAAPTSEPVGSVTAQLEGSCDPTPVAPSTPATSLTSSADQNQGKKVYERFGPYKPVRKALGGGLTEQQQASLNRLIDRFTQRTAKSRAHAQRHRSHFADPRGVAGYRRIWKSMVYQISVDRSQGSKLWDIDGNEYIDIAMGFGLNLFGQSPDFVTEALQKQLAKGVEVGPQSPLAGEVAQLLCDFSRKERATFCNTGSEAVMAAMRLARTVTGKNKVVYFNKDYHGNFDQVLVRSTGTGAQRRDQPAAPGIPDSITEQMLILDYGSDESLQTIKDRADEIAAVLVEPVQSADPFLQPREFLQELRRITTEHDIALIMDEVITGFRAAPGGAQEWFGVWGDMATYGKILGGGLPIGALAGTRRFMDALDGGDWRFEDQSEPEADMTFFAGTFVRHPLAMTAAHQILMKVKEEGPELQQQLNARTAFLADELNAFFERELYPIRVAQFTSLFRFMFPPTVEYADLLYFHLLDRGIFTRGWGDNCFLSTAHTDEDVRKIIDAVKDSCREIREGGFMPRPDEPDGDNPLDRIDVGNSNRVVPSHNTNQAGRNAPCGNTRNGKMEDATTPVTGQSSTDGSALANSPRSLPRLSTLEEIRSTGSRIPLFCMPAADGLTLVFHELAERLGDDQPVYGLNSPGAYGEEVPYTIEEMAARFIADMREEFPSGPYALAGYCSGGTIAFEAAQQLQAAGEKVVFLCGIETYDWGTAQSSRPTMWTKFYYSVQRFEFHVRNFLLLDWNLKQEYLQSKWRRLKSRTVIWKGMFLSLFSRHQGTKRSNASEVNWNEVWRAHDAQADRYRPRTYAGKLLLIRPKRDYSSYVGKNDLQASEGVEIVRLDAFPTGLMSAPFVDQLADEIRSRLDVANQAYTSSPACQPGPTTSTSNGSATHSVSELATA